MVKRDASRSSTPKRNLHQKYQWKISDRVHRHTGLLIVVVCQFLNSLWLRRQTQRHVGKFVGKVKEKRKKSRGQVTRKSFGFPAYGRNWPRGKNKTVFFPNKPVSLSSQKMKCVRWKSSNMRKNDRSSVKFIYLHD